MPDRERDLERELRELGSHVEFPPTPDLAREARRRLEGEQAGEERRAARRGRFWLPVLSPRWAVAAMFVIVLAVPLLSPAARDSLSGLLVTGSGGGSSGAGGGAGEDKMMSEQAGQAESQATPRGEPIPESAGGGQEQSAQASGAESGEDVPESGGGGQPESGGTGGSEAAVGFSAERITLREARSRTQRPILLPRGPVAGRPAEVYDAETSFGSALGLVYPARPGLPSLGDSDVGMVFTEATGDLESTYFENAPANRALEEVNVGSRRGYWVPNARLDPLTSGQSGRPRVSVLFWEREGLSRRLESTLTKEEAVQIAESVR